MKDAHIGRVLVASLHQGIADIIPNRLSFYENWLSPRGLRNGTIGIAPLYAVLSFLRQEGEVYTTIMTRAGEYAAEWTVAALSAPRRMTIRWAPRSIRSRILLGVARQLVRRSYDGSRAITHFRGGTAQIDLRASVFCSVREPVTDPLCVFYAAACTRLMTLFNIVARAEVISCRGTGETNCVLRVVTDGAKPQ